MSNLKPIVPGCLCIIIDGPYTGETVTALQFVGKIPYPTPITDYWRIQNSHGYTGWGSQRALMRIDGDDETQLVEDKQLENV